jgi:hypothetical protein
MADIADELAEQAARRGFGFTPASRAALARDFPRLHELQRLDAADRAVLFDLILDEVAATRGSPPFDLDESDIYTAAGRFSRRLAIRATPFSPAAQGIIRDCCPFC